jgi:hypothetical protein
LVVFAEQSDHPLIVVTRNGDRLATAGKMGDVVLEVREERCVVLSGCLEQVASDDHAIHALHDFTQLSIEERLILGGVRCTEMKVTEVKKPSVPPRRPERPFAKNVVEA